MDSPPQSPNHVFNFPENEEWDDMDIIEEEEEDPEEDPEEWDDVGAAEQVDEIPHPVTPPRNPTAAPHSSPGQSSESEDNDLAISDEAQDASPPKSTYEIGSTSLHDAVNMARELVEQSVQGKAARSAESGKRKWDDNRRNNQGDNNRNRNNQGDNNRNRNNQ
ncbi:hypothetical protein Tco_0334629, partial [Tanacetum coccineum]